MKMKVNEILKMLKQHHRETYTHSIFVAQIAREFAIKLNFSKKTVKTIYLAGLLHDIGKLSIPTSILSANRKLTKKEFDIIKKHPLMSANILSQIELGDMEEYRDMIKHIILFHHVKNVGISYPPVDKTDKTILADIVTICDIYAALVKKRDYKEAYTQEYAFSILRSSGLNTILVEIFIDSLTQRVAAI